MDNSETPDFYKSEYLIEAKAKMEEAIAEYNMYLAVDRLYNEYHEATLSGVKLHVAYNNLIQACKNIGYRGREPRSMPDAEIDAKFESYLKRYTQQG